LQWRLAELSMNLILRQKAAADPEHRYAPVATRDPSARRISADRVQDSSGDSSPAGVTGKVYSFDNDDEDSESGCSDGEGVALKACVVDSRSTDQIDELEADPTSPAASSRGGYMERLERLPRLWPLEVEVLAKKYQEHPRPEPVPMGLATGPATELCWWCALFDIGYFASLLWPGKKLETCSISGLGKPSSWWTATFFPPFALSVIIGIYGVRYAFPPYLQVCNKTEFAFPGKPIRCRTLPWLVWHFMLTFCSVANTANITKFTIIVIGIRECATREGNVAISAVWEEVWNQSTMLNRLGYFASLPTVAEIFFVLALVPYAVALLYTTPWPLNEARANYLVPSEDNPELPGYKYDTILSRDMNHGSALAILSEAIGLSCCVACTDTLYAKTKFGQQFEEADRAHGKMRVKLLLNCLRHVITQCERCAIRSGFGGVLKNGLQLNLQVTVLACRRAAEARIENHNAEVMFLSLWSITLGLVSVVQIWVDAYKVFCFAKEVLWNKRDKIMRMVEAEAEAEDVPEKMLRKVYQGLCAVKKFAFGLFLLTLTCALLVLYALIKLWMSHVCEHKVWNYNGCVDLSHMSLKLERVEEGE